MTGSRAATSGVLLDVAWILLLTFLAVGVACVVALLGIRARRRMRAERREREIAALRADLVAVVVGEEPDASESAARLIALRGGRWDRADELLIGMLPKVRGDAKEGVLAILRERGATERALREIRSGRVFARCRGAFALGAMGVAHESIHVVGLLHDHSALVRRVAIRSLGLMGDPAAAHPLLNAANRDDGVQRDVVQALVLIGQSAAPALHDRLKYAIIRPNPEDRAGPVAATALGLMGDVTAVRDLATAVERGAMPLQLAAAQALEHLDSPIGAPALQAALSSPAAQVQLAAATSLGRLGAQTAIPALLAGVERGDPTVSRSAASALLDLGPAGWSALVGSSAPYAVEAVAVETLRRGA